MAKLSVYQIPTQLQGVESVTSLINDFTFNQNFAQLKA